jgi:hypothetical protein
MGRSISIFSCVLAGVAITGFSFVQNANADTDNIGHAGQVNVAAISSPGNAGEIGGKACTPSSFSFDISWIDPFTRAYYLADRTHGGTSNGDILQIDLSNTEHTVTPLTPPANDPFAGVRCDQNAAFGGSAADGRNELTGPNGVYTVNHAEAWAGDGPSPFTYTQNNVASDYVNDKCDSSVRVFDLTTGKQTDHINIHGCFRTDEGAFDPADQLALFANPSEQPLPGNPHTTALNKSPFISLISTIPVKPGDSHQIVKQINFDGTHGTVNANGGIEQPVYVEKTGLFYIAVPGNADAPNNGWIAVVDPRGDADDIHVVRNIPTPGCNPHGLAIGSNDELYLGCNSGPEEIMDAKTGSIRATLAQTVGGCDEVTYNAGNDQFFGACGTGAPGQFGFDQIDAKPRFEVDQAKVPTAPGAHSIAADPVTVTTWIPAFGGAACGSGTACVAIYGSSGGDDRGVFAELVTAQGHDDHH